MRFEGRLEVSELFNFLILTNVIEQLDDNKLTFTLKSGDLTKLS